MRKCLTSGCPHYVRAGLRRFGEGAGGQPLADGRFCWRCRAGHADKDSRAAARRRQKGLSR